LATFVSLKGLWKNPQKFGNRYYKHHMHARFKKEQSYFLV
jgi:hypothetical protein